MRCEWFVELALAKALQDACDVSQEIGPVSGELAKLGNGGGVLGLGQLAPARVMPCRAVDLRYENAIRIGLAGPVSHYR